MGAMLIGGVRKIQDAELAQKILEGDPDNKFLGSLEDFGSIYIPSTRDILEAEREGDEWLANYFRKELGRFDLKMSGFSECEAPDGRIVEYEEVAERVVRVFERLNDEVEMMYYGGSCALAINPETGEGWYFTVSQIRRMTRDGAFLTGKRSSNYKPIMAAIKKHQERFPDLSSLEKETIPEDVALAPEGAAEEIGGLFSIPVAVAA